MTRSKTFRDDQIERLPHSFGAIPSMVCWNSDGEEAAKCGLSVTADLREAPPALFKTTPAATLYGAGSATTVRTVAR